MIDIQIFQMLLLVVCILAVIASAFIGATFGDPRRWVRWSINLLALALGVGGGFCALMLVILK